MRAGRPALLDPSRPPGPSPATASPPPDPAARRCPPPPKIDAGAGQSTGKPNRAQASEPAAGWSGPATHHQAPGPPRSMRRIAETPAHRPPAARPSSHRHWPHAAPTRALRPSAPAMARRRSARPGPAARPSARTVRKTRIRHRKKAPSPCRHPTTDPRPRHCGAGVLPGAFLHNALPMIRLWRDP